MRETKNEWSFNISVGPYVTFSSQFSGDVVSADVLISRS